MLGSVDKGIPQGADGNLDQSQVDWLRMMPDGWDGTPPTLGDSDAADFARRVEQAVAKREPLTLFGVDYEVRGECEFKPFHDEDWSEPNAVHGVCSACSALMHGGDNYCANCGRRVKGGL